MGEILKVTHLSKKFSDIKAVDDLSFSVGAGQVYGFLGQNGAGKSTTIRMLLSLIEPDDGEIEVFGLRLRNKRKEILKMVGAIIEKPDMYKYLSAYENLKLFAVLSGKRLSEKILMDQLEKVGLAERAHSKVQTFSQGMKQRLGIAVALVHDPELIILDEPINGLDPQGIADMRRIILDITATKKKTVFISSHLLNEMETIADSMLIIDRGKKVAEGRKDELLNPANTVVELITDDIEKTLSYLKQSSWSGFIKKKEDQTILLDIKHGSIPALNRDLVAGQINVLSLRPKHSLEDLFLSLTAHT
jgi:ABC-type multidrug transport system ATPase subunit